MICTQGINGAAYNASKSAVHQLARSLAAEWGHPQNTFGYYPAGQPKREAHPPIRVNTISPGHIQTPLTAEAQELGLVDDWAIQNMLGRISQVEEYRAPVLFLLGDGSSYMTGAVSISSHVNSCIHRNRGYLMMTCRMFVLMEDIVHGNLETSL